MLKRIMEFVNGGKVNQRVKDDIAELLKVNPELLDRFEASYQSHAFNEKSNNLFDVSAKEASDANKEGKLTLDDELNTLVGRIVDELLIEAGLLNKQIEYISSNEINSLPVEVRPQLTGKLVKRDIKQPSYIEVLTHYSNWLKTGKEMSYHLFRQGLDILDLDSIMYEIIGTNKNSMGYWLSDIEQAVDKTGFFKYPKTRVVKVPLSLLQLTRLDYQSHSASTIKVVNEFCMKAFDLDVDKKYFIKTGTYSSKFDFRNALVQGEKEVRELGEYLLFIHFQALMMASPLSSRQIYGVSTTNEWVVREFIEDVENNPKIYKGMPLRTEYRFFVDLDTKEILGVSPYWREDVMKKSLGSNDNDHHKNHDYVIYKTHEEKLARDYNANVGKLTDELQLTMNKMNLKGQWSIDIMQNGDEFYIIDLASASESALSDVVDPAKLKKTKESWIPKLENTL